MMKKCLLFLIAALAFVACEDAVNTIEQPPFAQLVQEGAYDAVNLLVDQFDAQSINEVELVDDLTSGGMGEGACIAEFRDGKWQVPIPVYGCGYHMDYVFNADQTGWVYCNRWLSPFHRENPWFRTTSTWKFDAEKAELWIESTYQYRVDLIDRTEWKIIEGEVQDIDITVCRKVVYYESPYLVYEAGDERILVNLQERSHDEWIDHCSNFEEGIWVDKQDK
ncbi:MAG: hypothetical protein J6A66_07020 [Alistipes sp.]|nr:hypothetical protein [Alistipes sp.]